jgi:type II secretory pathway component PulF
MPLFDYKVKDRAGNTRTGQLEAESEHAAAVMIREAGGLPMEIHPARGAGSGPSSAPAGNAFVRYLIHPLWTGVNIGHLMFFFRQLETLLGAGMSLSEALRSVASRSRGSMGRILRGAQLRVQAGGRLSDEMARHPRVFAELQVSLVRAGEESGMLGTMAGRIASYLEYEMTIRRRVATATFYPFLLVVFLIIKPAVVAYFTKTPHDAWAVLAASLETYGVALIAFIVAVKLVMQFRSARLVWDAIKIQPPILGTVARKIAMSRFCKALALLYSSGLPVTRAVAIAAEASANVAIGNMLKCAIPALNQGYPLTDSLQRTGAVLPVVLEMMAIGDKTGSYDAVLQKVADYMDDEADATIQKLSIALFVVMILIVGALVAIDVLRQMMGYISGIEERAGQ